MNRTPQRLSMCVLMMILIMIASCGSNTNNDPDHLYGTTGQTTYVSEDMENTFAREMVYTNDGSTPEDSAKDTITEDQANAVQREIVEADIIKVYGTRLFILNQYRGMIICDISDPDHPTISARVPLKGEPVEMYVENNIAYVLSNIPNYCYAFSDAANGESGSVLYEIDVSDAVLPGIINAFELEGYVTESRLVGDIIYVVSTRSNYFSPESYGAASFVTSFNLSQPGNIIEIDQKKFNSDTGHIHVTNSAIFTVANTGGYLDNTAVITYIDIADAQGYIKIRGDISLKGYIQDKFKLNAFNGYLRVCTYDRVNRESLLYVVTMDNPDVLNIVGQLMVVSGEQLFATRFDGNKAYMVTFEVIDPLWVIDLSDPQQPFIAGELEVPGWSTHIEAKGDRLIALGVDDSATRRQVSVSYFNVADASNPSLIKRLTFGEEDGWSFSSGYYDEKALTIIDSLGLILLPYTTSVMDGHYYRYENRLQLISFTENDLIARGRVVQNGTVLRSGSYDNRLFSISNDELQVINAANPDAPVVTARLPLMENVRQLVNIDTMEGYGVKAIDKADGTTILQAVSLDDLSTPIGKTLNVGTGVTTVFSDQNRVYVVSHHTPENDTIFNDPASVLMIIDYAIPEAPVKKGRLVIPGTYYSVYNPQKPSGLLDTSGSIFNPGNHRLLFVSGGYPHLRVDGATEAKDLRIEPENYPSHQRILFVADLRNSEKPKLIAKKELRPTAQNAFFQGKTLFYTFRLDIASETEDSAQPLTRYFLSRIVFVDPEDPTELKPINIPGIALGMDAKDVVLYSLNAVRDQKNALQFSLNTAYIKDDQAYFLDAVQLKTRPKNYIVTNQFAYFDTGYPGYITKDSSQTSYLAIGDLRRPENLSVYYHVIDSDGCYRYNAIAWANGKRLATNTWDTLFVYDVVEPSEIDVLDRHQYKSWLRDVTGIADSLYFSLGYDGIYKTEL